MQKKRLNLKYVLEVKNKNSYNNSRIILKILFSEFSLKYYVV